MTSIQILPEVIVPGMNVPLCVDLDGTLTRTDVLVESFLVLVKKNPVYLLLCIGWLLHGKANLKEQIAQRVSLDVSLLPYNARFVDFLREQRSTGRDLYLCTASNQRFAEQVATYFGFFKGVLASDEARNLSGNTKAGALSAEFGVHGFDYCGDALADVPVWKESRHAIVVGNRHIAAAAEKVNKTIVFFEQKRSLVRLTITVHRLGRRFAARWTPPRGKLHRFARQLNQGFDFLLKRKERMIAPTLWILFDWVLTVGVLWAAFWAVDNPLPPSIVIMGFGVGLFFSLVSFIPGGLGIMEGSMTAVFVSLGVKMETSVLAVLIFRLTYQVVPLVVSLFLFHGVVRQAIRQVAGGGARG